MGSRHKIIFFICLIVIPFLFVSCSPQETRVNQKKIARERAQKQKQAVSEYNKAVKRHNNMQSKSTKASMKKTKKESVKVTPTKR
jgi:hypothetical protein